MGSLCSQPRHRRPPAVRMDYVPLFLLVALAAAVVAVRRHRAAQVLEVAARLRLRLPTRRRNSIRSLIESRFPLKRAACFAPVGRALIAADTAVDIEAPRNRYLAKIS